MLKCGGKIISDARTTYLRGLKGKLRELGTKP